jgi:hypothetical protein
MSMSRIAPIYLGILILTLVGSSLTSTPALAGEPRTHDGFFLRLSAGGGYASSAVNVAGIDVVELSGGAGDLNLAIGGTVSPNLIVHGTIFGWSLSDPTVKLVGIETPDFRGDFTLSVWGGGITYYFMPANIYISPNVGFATISGGDDFDGNYDGGFALDVTLGKEWWVGNSWGLGVAGAFGYHNVADGDIDENWSGTSFVLRFTATLN